MNRTDTLTYEFDSRLEGKTSAQMIMLKVNLENGLKCAIATHSPERTKRDFEYMTGVRLELNLIEGTKNVYSVNLK